WEVIKDHGALADAVESKDGEGVEEVVETVLQGEKHEGERPTDPHGRKAITEPSPK
ncbi:MAG: hypothetical protein QOI66_4824, partial [Myxococcales bacterium]|nr:hypothetical protein [Myxococcales bacterium]